MPNHIVLYQPEIPANTGNISRTCAGTDTHLHLIRPLGFSTDDKMLKRAGLDYWDHVKLAYYDSLDEFFQKNKEGNYYCITKFARHLYSDACYQDDKQNHYFIFGKETTGLPKELLQKYEKTALRIPMTDKIRSLNLSNTAAIIIYEALRQQHFGKLDVDPHYEQQIFHD
ncbi:tRNA (uridine(34)/cytosine(34)/5-carboxymethylaminomethyluridine(34)-2'-O)-methyltransferase TrmL [Listeria sp. PSOL-1]|uniref:tRNA (uridine(34)/cytosine(34)/5- carboxymethylaminomethyluridine(34)-2'-O)- methyltransferase TrmL n=1 Tax=Listeria sp. PSOL-1 TaxID=1844999 RepID=UPI0013D59470|nr:tRNA (uridine(34)/cytosine(34)/5-carboxymethylaminomethyluridine(34)-2'-O)-methyltransferase TrmL [Listeria sp. PSOL-1]